MNYFWIFPIIFLCIVYIAGIFIVSSLIFEDIKDKVISSRKAVLWPILLAGLVLKLLLIAINYILSSMAFACGLKVGQKYENSWLNKISNVVADTLK